MENKIILRDYQIKYVNALKEIIDKGEPNRVCLVAPTGAGKTSIASAIIHSYPDKKILFLAHKKDLIVQCSLRLSKFKVKHCPITDYENLKFIFAKDNKYIENKNEAQVILGCKQTIFNRIQNKQLHNKFDIIIVDEAHLVISEVYKNLLLLFDKKIIIGMTGTPQRQDGKPLKEIFNSLMQFTDEGELIEQNYLSKFVYYAPNSIDVTKISKKIGDYNEKETYKEVKDNLQFGDVIKEYQRLANHTPCLIFCINIEHCNETATYFEKSGYKVKVVHSKMKEWEKIDAVEKLKKGEIEIICSVNCLIEGTDIERVESIIILRPTCSLRIHRQMLGRGARLFENKKHCIVIDMVGNLQRLGKLERFIEWSLESPPKKTREEINIICPNCKRIFNPKITNFICPKCHNNCVIEREREAVKTEIEVLDNYQLEIFEEKKQERQEKREKIRKAIIKAVYQLHNNLSISDLWNKMYNITLKNLMKENRLQDFIDFMEKVHKQKKLSKLEYLSENYPEYFEKLYCHLKVNGIRKSLGV